MALQGWLIVDQFSGELPFQTKNDFENLKEGMWRDCFKGIFALYVLTSETSIDLTKITICISLMFANSNWLFV